MMHIGLVDFSEPTLLFLGDVDALRWLAELIESRQSIDFAATPFASLVNVRLLLDPTDGESGLGRSGSGFVWSISSYEASKFAEQLRELVKSKIPAHAYLDPKSNSSGVQIVVSRDEYDPNIVFES